MMGIKRKMIILGATLFCLGCGHGDRNISLRLKYKLGDQVDLKYHFYVVKDGDLDNPLVNEIVRMGFKVDSVTGDSLYVLSAKVNYLRVQYDGFLTGQNFSYEEDDADTDSVPQQSHRYIRSPLDSTFKLVINSKGTIIRPFAIRGPAIIRNLEPLNYSNCQVVFPAGKVAVGDDWPGESAMPEIGAKRISTYHIERILGGKIQIKESGRIELKRNVSMDFSERYVLDEKTKNLISAKLELNADSWGRGGLKAVIDIEAKNWGFM